MGTNNMFIKYSFTPEGVCCKEIIVTIDPATFIIHDVEMVGGCPGGHAVLRKLSIGKKVSEVEELFQGIKCGKRETSCADQLSKSCSNIKRSEEVVKKSVY